MGALTRRIAKMERERPAPPGCRRCAGKRIGVEFTAPAPGDYEGPDAPMPPFCPDCGRRMPKTYTLPDRAFWDAITSREPPPPRADHGDKGPPA